MTSRIAFALVCAFGAFLEAHAAAVAFVAEAERNRWWELESSDLPPRLGMYLRPGHSLAFEIEYTIQSDGTVSDADVVESTDSTLPKELLLELISSHHYRPGAQNEQQRPVRTRMVFRLGAPRSGSAAAKACSDAADPATSSCPK